MYYTVHMLVVIIHSKKKHTLVVFSLAHLLMCSQMTFHVSYLHFVVVAQYSMHYIM